MSKHHSEEYKRMVVKQYSHCIPAAEICKQYGIARSTLFLWVKQYTADETGQIPREAYLMQKEVERLRTENQIFKVCGCSPISPLQDRIAAIKANQEKFSIHALCRTLDVNRSTYYYHALRSPVITQLQAEDDKLKPIISEMFEKSSGRFGARKIRAKMVQSGYIVSERRVLRLMKEPSSAFINK